MVPISYRQETIFCGTADFRVFATFYLPVVAVRSSRNQRVARPSLAVVTPRTAAVWRHLGMTQGTKSKVIGQPRLGFRRCIMFQSGARPPRSKVTSALSFDLCSPFATRRA